MKIYLSAAEPHAVSKMNKTLFSYYDIYISRIPFRKKTWRKIINEDTDSRGNGRG